MLRKAYGVSVIAILALCGVSLSSLPAMAKEKTSKSDSDEQAGAAGADESAPSRTYRTESEVRNGLANEFIGVRPQIGFIAYDNFVEGGDSRLAFGFTIDMNALQAFDVGLDPKTWYIGPSSGLIFSHLGAADSNFFGENELIPNNLGSNLFMIPLNAKVAYMVTDVLRVGVHGGGNLTIRSIANSMSLSPETSDGTENEAILYPNIGADIEFQVSRSISLGIRPDLTLTSGDDIFTGTMALVVPLGVT